MAGQQVSINIKHCSKSFPHTHTSIPTQAHIAAISHQQAAQHHISSFIHCIAVQHTHQHTQQSSLAVSQHTHSSTAAFFASSHTSGVTPPPIWGAVFRLFSGSSASPTNSTILHHFISISTISIKLPNSGTVLHLLQQKHLVSIVQCKLVHFSETFISSGFIISLL